MLASSCLGRFQIKFFGRFFYRGQHRDWQVCDRGLGRILFRMHTHEVSYKVSAIRRIIEVGVLESISNGSIFNGVKYWQYETAAPGGRLYPLRIVEIS